MNHSIMINPITERVRKKANKLFGEGSAREVIDLLEQAELPLINNNGERVHLGILHLSRGDFQEFNAALAQAKIDWRDTLVAAGLANGNWRQILMERGDW